MNRHLFLSFCFLFFVACLSATPISQKTAQKAARGFLYQKLGLNLNLSVEPNQGNSGSPEYYVFSINSPIKGFAIVAGDDASKPILAYSFEGPYSSSNMSPSYQKWMEWYRKQIQEIRSYNLKADSSISAEWKLYLDPAPSQPIPQIQAVNPLLQVKWNQAPYYNALCPYDNAEGERTVSGCVATAMAQIMKFWNYPAQGTGSHSYAHSTYGTLSANFASSTYNWSGMPNKLTGNNQQVAQLMYDCGVSVDMDYGVSSQGGSGAYVISSKSPYLHCSEYAFKTYFGYDENLEGLQRASFTQSIWIQKLKTELDASRPILYAGFGQGGHAFVCDGYDNNDYFHFNWGWGGIYDGYFSINSLNPGTGGAGAGAGTYNNGQQAILNLKPKSGGGGNVNPELEIYSTINISPSPVNYLNAFEVEVAIANSGNSNITGDFGAAVFNSDNEFVDFVETITGGTLNSSSYANATFTTAGMAELVPGSYTVGIYFKQGSGDWNIIDPGSYSSFATFQVVGEQGDIRLHAAVEIAPYPLKQNQAFTVSLNIANYNSNNSFNGDISIDLHKSDGTWVRELGIKENLSLPALSYFTNGLTYNLSGLTDDPGNYKIQVWYLPDGGDWELVSPSTFENPISFTLGTPGLSPDPFETNNTESSAKAITVNFSGNSATVRSLGSNIHVGNDQDYYKLVLAPGYDYTISGRVHDSYSSGNGNTYTVDASFSYQKAEKWSDYYDDILAGNILIEDGGELLFNVSPYFTGQTGTYLLDLQVERVKRNTTFTSIPLEAQTLVVYPNPARTGQKIVLSLKELNQEVDWTLQGFSIDGKQMNTIKYVQTEHGFDIQQDWPKGVYIVKVESAQHCYAVKIVIE